MFCIHQPGKAQCFHYGHGAHSWGACPATLVASQSRLWFWEKNNMVSVLICLCLSHLWQLGSTCIISKRPEMSFPLFVPPGITDRGMHRVPLNGCTVCCTHSRLRMHTIQLSASPPRHRPKFMCREPTSHGSDRQLISGGCQHSHGARRV